LTNGHYTFVLRLTLFCLGGDILFTNGFMLLRVPPVGPGIPINEVLLVFNLGAILFMRLSNVRFSDTPMFAPLVFLWMQATVQLAIGLHLGGFWAIRDAANLIETGFVFIGFWFASDPRFLPIFIPWFRRVLTFQAFYILLYPLQDMLIRFSPIIPSVSGYDAPLFFNYANPSSVPISAACQMIVSDYGPRLYRTLATAAILMVLVVFVQARLVYLQLGLLLVIILLFNPQRLSSFGTMAIVTASLVVVFLLSGIQLPGRLGTTFTLDFFVNHFTTIWGGGANDESTSAAAEGVNLRVGWWIKIHHDLQRDLPTWMFGLGYGIPLTSFYGPSSDLVREPHNSFFSIYGRLGIFGIVNFLLMQIIVLVTTIRLIFLTKRDGLIELHGIAITILCFLGAHLLYSSGECGFEVSFGAVPYYFLTGVVVALHMKLAQREKARAIDFVKSKSSIAGPIHQPGSFGLIQGR
jgi:O-Antigen ligase